MRLDHLLSREKAKAEMPELIPGRTVQGSRGAGKGRKAKEGTEAEKDWRKSDRDRRLNSHREGQHR